MDAPETCDFTEEFRQQELERGRRNVSCIMLGMAKTRDQMFDDKWTPEPNTGCFIWYGATLPNGYGKFWNGERLVYAHRYAWDRANKTPAPEGLDVAHRCDCRFCVNPDHLFLATRQRNIEDMVDKGRCRRSSLPHGVTRQKNGTFFGHFTWKGRRYHCQATFGTAEEAATAVRVLRQRVKDGEVIPQAVQRKRRGRYLPGVKREGRGYMGYIYWRGKMCYASGVKRTEEEAHQAAEELRRRLADEDGAA